MRILVDTSVWSHFFRKKGPAPHAAVNALATFIRHHEEIVLLGIIYQEILQAFRSEATAQKVAGGFASFPLFEISRSDYYDAARLHCQCAAKGIVTSTVDCLIATAAINSKSLLLTTDKDFHFIARHSVLQLVPGII
jgi:predicted nucleic acid-binding protein